MESRSMKKNLRVMGLATLRYFLLSVLNIFHYSLECELYKTIAGDPLDLILF